MIARIKAVWGRREILRLLIGRDLKIRYADSYLGYLWSILDPLLMALVFWFIFTVVVPGRGSGIGAEPYILFLLVGLLPWNWFNGVVNGATKAITGQSKLVRSTSLPREIWVLRLVGAKFAEFMLSVPVVILFMLVFTVAPTWYVLTIPLAILIQAVLLVGLSLFVASVTVLVGDLERLVKILLRLTFYMTPILYSAQRVYDEASKVPDIVQIAYSLNPMVGILELYRAALFPQEFVGWWLVGISAGVSIISCLVGMVTFARLESAVLKEL